MKIDDCLDGGGAWDYPQNTCIENKISKKEVQCLSKKGSWNAEKNICEY